MLPQPQVPLQAPLPSPEILALLRDLSPADFQAWRRNPVSRVFLQFLGDQAADQLAETAMRWLGGALTLDGEKERRGRILALNDVLGLRWEAIQGFYDAKQAQQGDTLSERQAAPDLRRHV